MYAIFHEQAASGLVSVGACMQLLIQSIEQENPDHILRGRWTLASLSYG
jgi:hypothetical protein